MGAGWNFPYLQQVWTVCQSSSFLGHGNIARYAQQLVGPLSGGQRGAFTKNLFQSCFFGVPGGAKGSRERKICGPIVWSLQTKGVERKPSVEWDVCGRQGLNWKSRYHGLHRKKKTLTRTVFAAKGLPCSALTCKCHRQIIQTQCESGG